MVILDSQQFGLAQLHQLRGRVGRSSLPSLCIAMHRHELTDAGLARLQAFAQTTDGFELAEADLRLRKEGMSWAQGSRVKPRTCGSSPFAAMNPSFAWPKKQLMRSSRMTRRWTIIRTSRAPFAAPPKGRSSGCNAPEACPVG